MQQYYIMRPTGRGAPSCAAQQGPCYLWLWAPQASCRPPLFSCASLSTRQLAVPYKWDYQCIQDKYNLIQHRRRRPRPAIPRDQLTADPAIHSSRTWFSSQEYSTPWITFHKTEPQSSISLLQPKNLHSVKSTSLDSVRRRYGQL